MKDFKRRNPHQFFPMEKLNNYLKTSIPLLLKEQLEKKSFLERLNKEY